MDGWRGTKLNAFGSCERNWETGQALLNIRTLNGPKPYNRHISLIPLIKSIMTK